MEDIVSVPLEERGVDAKWEKKVIIYSHEDVLKDEFIPPKRYYINNAFYDYVYISALRRDTAQGIVDEIYGKGKYVVKMVVKAVAH